MIIVPKSLKQDHRVQIWAAGGPKSAVSERRADSGDQKRGKKKKSTVKMIFIDWLAAAAVRLHYEPKAQVRPPGRTSEPVKWSSTNGPVLGVQLGKW